MRKIKVLQSVASLGIGGTEIFVMNFFRHIDKEKFQVDFVIYDDTRMNFYEEVKATGSKVYVCSSKSKSRLWKTISEMRQVRKLLMTQHYDIIHCHGNSFREFFRGAIPGWLTKNTYVITHSHNPGEPKHTLVDDFLRSILKLFVSHIVDVGCSCSDVAARGKYTERFIEKSPRYQIINNAIDSGRYMFDAVTRSDIRRKLGIQGEFVIGHVGRISYEKNHLFLIDIFYEYLQRDRNAKLLLVGDGALRKDVEKKVKDYHMETMVVFIGRCECAAQYYQAMDCFVLPSVFEGFGLVNIEAQVSGLPCIVSSVVPREVDISSDVSFLPLEKEYWIQEIEKVRKHINRRERKTVDAGMYDIQKECKHLEEIYEKVISE